MPPGSGKLESVSAPIKKITSHTDKVGSLNGELFERGPGFPSQNFKFCIIGS